MHLDIDTLRAIEAAVEALTRLDEQVASIGPGFRQVVRLRTAQAIVAAADRPPNVDRETAAASISDAGRSELSADDTAALLAWWFAPAGRAFVAVNPFLRAVAVALDAAVESRRHGTVLSGDLIDALLRAGGVETRALSDLIDASLSVAVREKWPPLLTVADLAAGACGRERALAASVLRALVPMMAGLTSDVLIAGAPAADMAAALREIVDEASEVQHRIAAYRAACKRAERSCEALGRASCTAQALVRILATRPAVTVAEAAGDLEVSIPTAGAVVERLLQLGALREVTGRARDRVFVYAPAAAFVG